MEFGWITWVAVLVAWTLIGLLVAYMFGGWARRNEASDNIVGSSKVSYLRRKKHPSGLHSAEAKPRRVAGGRGRR